MAWIRKEERRAEIQARLAAVVPRVAKVRRWLERKPLTWTEFGGKLTTLLLPSTYGGCLAVLVIVVLLLVPLWLWYASGQKDDKGAVTYPHAGLICFGHINS